jgi:CBS-domain-containing membrane protein
MMATASKPFAALTAGDVMSRSVVTIPEEMALQAAARLLAREQISGAPVVDAEGRCVGALSATNFVHWARDGGRPGTVRRTASACVCSDWQVVEVELLPRNEVREHMTTHPLLAPACTQVSRLARMMVDAHSHRVIIIDAQRRPIGVVSSMDVLAAVASPGSDPDGG